MAALLSRMVRQSVYRAAQTSRSRRDGRHRRAQRPSRFVQVALEADPRVRAIAEWLLCRLAAAAQPRLVPIDRDRAPTFGDDLERSLNMVRPVVLGRDRDVAHLIPPAASGLRPCRSGGDATRGFNLLRYRPSGFGSQRRPPTLLVARARAGDSGHHGSDRAIAAGTGELERLPRRDADACGDVVAEQHPRAVETGLHGFRVDVEAGRRFGRTQALPLPQHEDRAVDLGQRIYGFLDLLVGQGGMLGRSSGLDARTRLPSSPAELATPNRFPGTVASPDALLGIGGDA